MSLSTFVDDYLAGRIAPRRYDGGRVVDVYRVQDAHGGGPYQGGSTFSRDLGVSHSNVAHPGPADFADRTYDADSMAWRRSDGWDRIQALSPEARFGFASLEQRDAWFTTTEQTELAEHGYSTVRLTVYEAGVLRGGHQVVFDPAAVVSGFDYASKEDRS